MYAALPYDISSVDLTQKVTVHCKSQTSHTTLGKMLKKAYRGDAMFIAPYTLKITVNKKLVKKRVYKRDNYTCVYCGNPVTTIDHIVPKSRGGGTTVDNCAASCKPCNIAKGALLLEEFKPGLVIKTI